MAFLNLKRNKKDDASPSKKGAAKEKKANAKESGSVTFYSGSKDIILRPRITEKASQIAENNTYTFDVSAFANKKNIKQEINRIYKVTPISVNITKVPAKAIFSRGKAGVKKGGRKAYVTLKKGDRIEFV